MERWAKRSHHLSPAKNLNLFERMDTKGGKWWVGGGGGGMNWETGIDMYTLICIKWITNKKLLYKKINKIKFLKKD